MTITAIGIGAAPGDDTGDGLRTAFNKVNNNFSDANNAASKLVGIATGEIPDADDLGMVGASENYTSNNLNPNVFGGVGITDTIGQGFAESANIGVFLLPISSNQQALSVTVTDSFTIIDSSFNVIASNITSFVFSARSSNKICQIATSALSGMAVGATLQLVGNTAASKIEVNY